MNMTPLIAGNWKMNMTRGEAHALADGILRGLPQTLEGADVAVFPPFTAISEVVATISDSDITVGGQNVYPEDKGAFTGEISAPMLLDAGATRVLAGHSERRHVLGEDDSFVNRKMKAAFAHDMLPTLCVGETLDEREAGRMEEVVERQVRAGLDGIGAERAPGLTLAYEPVWAIGTGLTASPEQAGEAHAFIRGLLVDLFGAAGSSIRILYGGSAKPQNARELLAVPEIGGLLIGGAALTADSFCRMVQAAISAPNA
jgi:triosephosphate isomerase